MALALDILEDYPQPDIMLVKMCDLDGARHTYGVSHPAVEEQLHKHGLELEAIMEALRRKGTLDDTNIVILGDHGMTDISEVLLLNQLFCQEGFLRADGDGNITDYDAICHSTGLAAYIELRDPNDIDMRLRMRAFLESLRHDPDIALTTVMCAEEALASFGVEGPFDFIIESSRPMSFGEKLSKNGYWGSQAAGDHKIGAATHGGGPVREELTFFAACGPAVRQGAAVARRPLVDEAPTLARMMGFEMHDIDGTPILDILR